MTNEVITEYKLTQFTESSGCGCKIPPELLSTLLAGRIPIKKPDNLLVGAETKDDAAAYDMGNGQAMICTADFFTPIVDDAFNFGRIAAANAISDVYAMGGKPQTALALLGFPVNKMPIAIAGKIMEGAEIVCQKAGIVIA
ncbi:MAG: selenide, water dikinase SelD, partial [Chitinophagia bacterium]|nr:selenide, water dikinase SelD [Chitinophagia bacterium]